MQGYACTMENSKYKLNLNYINELHIHIAKVDKFLVYIH